MKKTCLILSFILLCSFSLVALASTDGETIPAATLTPATTSETPLVEPLAGEIVETNDLGFVLQDSVHGMVQVNIAENTVFDGLLTEALPHIGDIVFVDYDGKMTRSIPAQVTATRVSLYIIKAVVEEVLDGALMATTDLQGQVIINLPEGMASPKAGDAIRVYYNGVMTLNLPAEVVAHSLLVYY